MTERLVTDAEAEEWEIVLADCREMDGRLEAGTNGEIVARLLPTRAAFVEFLNEHTPGDCEHRDCGTRAWCYGCQEWCYDSAPCLGCDGRALLAELHGDSTSGTSAPPETEEP